MRLFTAVPCAINLYAALTKHVGFLVMVVGLLLYQLVTEKVWLDEENKK